MANLPYTMDMYKQDLQKMMRNPMATGQPQTQAQPAGNGIFDKLRAAAQNVAATAMAGTSLG